MSVTSVLVAGAGPRGFAASTAFARRGLEVALVERGRERPGDGELEPGGDVRLELTLVGAVDVDSHVEAELSNGRVENYDAIVIADGRAAEQVAAGASSHRVFVLGDADDIEALADRVIRGGAQSPR
ncbi:NAD(P)/FAD-dependent oxidoreductase [Microbacterium fluvii]|uniref:NAD(P)/FAD-dependent oxidoreductase n=1 Tax=Microbacterium fluvii TaxID=415215 RepID=A0ABW2HG62_9MICO|nr:NAD(P)/FAD-dependent oxidoreductase [Microbacterium fluvii]MCU4673203.1 NAD(P)/FAD-dependent oxidoreductase [Microbacterium fluvii]